MVEEGGQVPSFTLTGYYDGERDQYNLPDTLRDGSVVMLLFYPCDFSPVCTAEMCSLRDADWHGIHEELEVWGISTDSLYAHRAFAEQYDINFPLLTDDRAAVAEEYGVKYDWWDGHQDLPKRAIFVISPEGTVTYRWVSEDAYVVPDMHPARRAIEAITGKIDVDLPAPEMSDGYDRREPEL